MTQIKHDQGATTGSTKNARGVKESQLAEGSSFDGKWQVWSLFWQLKGRCSQKLPANSVSLPSFTICFQVCRRNLLLLSLSASLIADWE